MLQHVVERVILEEIVRINYLFKSKRKNINLGK